MEKRNTSPRARAQTRHAGLRILLPFLLLAVTVGMPSHGIAAETGSTPGDAPASNGIVRLSPAEQRRSGIELVSPELTTLTPELQAFGRVVDIEPLLKLYSACEQAGAEVNAARASLDASGKALQRMKRLNEDAGNVSARQLQEADAAYQEDLSRVRTAKVKLDSARDQLAQRWGAPLARSLLDDRSLDLSRFVHQQRVLVLVTLGPDEALPDSTQSIMINRSDDRAAAWSADLVAPAPYTAGDFQGETWFFSSASERLRVGMRIYAWVPQPGEPSRGVMLPGSAIVWSGGKPWVFVVQSSGEFARRELRDPVDLKTRWFVPDPSLAGRQVVSTGGQMLLSEEYQRAIPDEDDQP